MVEFKMMKNLETISVDSHLAQPVSKSHVLDHLCKVAVETDFFDVREALIETLKDNADEANKRFTDYAMQSSDPSRRRWALINLSLMECQTAKDAVLKGLQDPFSEVRNAAVFHAALYDDEDVLAALEHFFEIHTIDGFPQDVVGCENKN